MPFSTRATVASGLLVFVLGGHADASLISSGALYLNPEAGSSMSYSVTGGAVTFTHGIEGVFSLDNTVDKGALVRYTDGRNWGLEFDAPTYQPATNSISAQPLEVRFYERAQAGQSNLPTRPGISIYGPASYAFTQSGWFNVLDVAYSPSGLIERLAVDFKQYDGAESTGKSTYGSLRLNSSVPLNLNANPPAPVPLPTSAWLLACGLGALALRAHKQRRRA